MSSISQVLPRSAAEKARGAEPGPARDARCSSHAARGDTTRDLFVRGGEGLVVGSVGATSGLISGALFGLAMAYGYVDGRGDAQHFSSSGWGRYSDAGLQRIRLIASSVTWSATALGAASGAAMGASRTEHALMFALAGPILGLFAVSVGLAFGAGTYFVAKGTACMVREATGIEAAPAGAALVIGGATALGAAMGALTRGTQRSL